MGFRIVIEVKPNLDYIIGIYGEHNMLKAIGALLHGAAVLRRDLKPPPFDVKLAGFKLTIISESPNREPEVELTGSYTLHEVLGVVRVVTHALEAMAAQRNQGLQDRIHING